MALFEKVWEFATPGGEANYSSPSGLFQVRGPDATADTTAVVIQAWDWYFYVLDNTDGSVVWRWPATDSNYGRAVGADVNGDGFVEFFTASHSGLITSLKDIGDGDSGYEVLWQLGSIYQRAGSGTATSGGQYSLIDSSQSWPADVFIRSASAGFNASIEITGGTGVGQTLEISGNDATTIWTFDEWSPQPDATSTYTIHPKYPSDIYFQHAGTLHNDSGTWSLYVTGFDSVIMKVNAVTGAILWEKATNENIEPYPLVMDVTGDSNLNVVAVSVDGYTYCLDAATGAEVWKTATGQCDAFISYYDTGSGIDLLISSRDNRVYILNGATGAVKNRTVDVGGDIDGSPLVIPQTSGYWMVVGTDNGAVYCFDQDGNTIWRHYIIDAPFNASPVRSGNYIFVGDMRGALNVFKATTGEKLGALYFKGAIEGTPLVVNHSGYDHLYISCLDGTLHCYKVL